MGFHTENSKRLVQYIPEHHQDTFSECNLLCILLNRNMMDWIGDVIQVELNKPEYRELLRFTWLQWNSFEREMKKAGYSVDRTTFWHYRKKGYIDESFVRHDGQHTVYQLEGILAYFRGNNGTSGAPDK